MFLLLVWHLGVKIVMKYATARFVIYGALMDQASCETVKTGIRRGFLRNSQIYTEQTTDLNYPRKFFGMVLSAIVTMYSYYICIEYYNTSFKLS